MFSRKNFRLLIPAFFMLLFASCQTLKDTQDLMSSDDIDKSQLPKWALSVNELVKYPRASLSEKEIPSFNGKEVWIRRHNIIDSRTVKEITIVPTDKPDEYELKLELNKQGAMIAMRLCNEKIHPPWAFSIDGSYYSNVEFKKAPDSKLDDYSSVIISGSFSKEIAETLSKYSEANYEYLTRNKDEEDKQ